MTPSHLEFLAKHLRLAFYPKGESVMEPASGPARTLYIIKQGRVRGELESGRSPSADEVWELEPGECFPIGAMLARDDRCRAFLEAMGERHPDLVDAVRDQKQISDASEQKLIRAIEAFNHEFLSGAGKAAEAQPAASADAEPEDAGQPVAAGA